MDNEIKSAWQIAMEKVEKLGEASDEERLQWKYKPQGEQLAVKCLKEDCNLLVELSKFPESDRKFVAAGAAEVFLRNINLPRNDAAKNANKRAMDGLKAVKQDKTAVENVYSRIRHLFQHYVTQGEQQRKQAYLSFKADFEARVQQAVQKQMGATTGARIDVEKQPQFQQEWRRVQLQLEEQYVNLLNEYKRELQNIN